MDKIPSLTVYTYQIDINRQHIKRIENISVLKWKTVLKYTNKEVKP